MAARLGYALASGAAGTTALNIVSYLDMLLRGRPESSVPVKDVESLARTVGVGLGDGETAQQRKQGAGALIGLTTGLAGGVAHGLLDPLTRRLPRPLAAAALGLGVMAANDGASVALGSTDPGQWSPVDWVSDLLPHLAYGAATVATYDALRG
jgi:hypothetical protein